MPEITITNVLNDMTEEAFVSKICDEDTYLNCEINNNTTFSVKKFWTSKRYSGTPKFKNALIKSSLQIRKQIMKDNDEYVYVGLSRCKNFDHFFVPQRYHCYKFNHSLMNAQMQKCQLHVVKVQDATTHKDCNHNSQESYAYKIVGVTSNTNIPRMSRYDEA